MPTRPQTPQQCGIIDRGPPKLGAQPRGSDGPRQSTRGRINNGYSVTLGEDGALSILSGETHASIGVKLSVRYDRTGEERINVENNWQDAPSTTKFGKDDWI